MKNLSYLVLLILFSIVQPSQIQAEEVWNVKLDGELNWQKVTLYGNYLVSTSNSLKAFDQKSGELVWENSLLKNYSEENI